LEQPKIPEFLASDPKKTVKDSYFYRPLVELRRDLARRLIDDYSSKAAKATTYDQRIKAVEAKNRIFERFLKN
jgi:hypothetical protein